MLPNALIFHSRSFKKFIVFVDSKPLEKVIPNTLHHSQATFGSGNPSQKVDITCQPLPDSGQSQIMCFFDISRNFLTIFNFERSINDPSLRDAMFTILSAMFTILSRDLTGRPPDLLRRLSAIGKMLAQFLSVDNSPDLTKWPTQIEKVTKIQ